MRRWEAREIALMAEAYRRHVDVHRIAQAARASVSQVYSLMWRHGVEREPRVRLNGKRIRPGLVVGFAVWQSSRATRR